jgi:uncharacterized coiled-coil protein SlyX
MRPSIKTIAVAGVLLAIPLIGHVQQVPQQAPQPAPTFKELVQLVSAQTEVIKSLNKRVAELEQRVKALEEKAAEPPR